MDIRIVLLPNPSGDKTFRKYSEIITEKFPSFFQLGDNNIPHATLMHPKIDDKNINIVKEVLQSIASKTPPIPIEFENNKHEILTNNYISVFFKNDSRITNLRNILEKNLGKIILSRSEYKLPHITFTRIKNTKDTKEALSLLSKFKETKFILNQIAICEVGEHGACKKILFSCNLKI